MIGTVAYDAIETPFGKTDKIVGGAATYICLSSSFFAKKYNEQDEAYTKNNIGVQRRYDLSSPVSETIVLQ